jgi:alpha-tubulin suppressor-like RCC1 family protein
MGVVSLVPLHVMYFQKLIRKVVVWVSLGEAHTIVLDSEGSVYSFGWAELGQLGIKKLIGNKSPDFQIHKVSIEKCNKIAVGAISSYAISVNQKLFVWGSNQNGQLGLGQDK